MVLQNKVIIENIVILSHVQAICPGRNLVSRTSSSLLSLLLAILCLCCFFKKLKTNFRNTILWKENKEEERKKMVRSQ